MFKWEVPNKEKIAKRIQLRLSALSVTILDQIKEAWPKNDNISYNRIILMLIERAGPDLLEYLKKPFLWKSFTKTLILVIFLALTQIFIY